MTEPRRDPAAGHWLIIQMVRAIGIAFVLVGLLHTAGRVALLDGVPLWFGFVLVGIGFIDVFVLTRVFAKRWRSPSE